MLYERLLDIAEGLGVPGLDTGGTGGRRIDHRLGIVSAATAVLPPFTAALALELAPIRVNLIAAGFVDTPLSASLLGDLIDNRRDELTSTLPIGGVVTPEDVARLALHLMVNTALTGGHIRHRRTAAIRLIGTGSQWFSPLIASGSASDPPPR
jgi:NAD(P)-dependent dehydrogenase (short-subunit alcohol dehydrogenase family)